MGGPHYPSRAHARTRAHASAHAGGVGVPSTSSLPPGFDASHAGAGGYARRTPVWTCMYVPPPLACAPLEAGAGPGHLEV